MITSAMEQKTAVFYLGDRIAEPPHREMDEPTRELPLIAGRFAGRQWIVEDLQREAASRPPRSARPRRRRSLAALAACGMLAFSLLVGALMGQARLTALNDETVAVGQQVRELQEEQRMLLVFYEETRDLSSAEHYAVEQLGMQRPRSDQLSYLETAQEDSAAVLGVRRGQALPFFWGAFIDKLGVSSH